MSSVKYRIKEIIYKNGTIRYIIECSLNGYWIEFGHKYKTFNQAEAFILEAKGEEIVSTGIVKTYG